jgi:kinesin family protein 2/24
VRDDHSTKTLRPLRGSALAAAKARAHLAGGPPADQAEMVAAHDDLINVILEEEEAVIAAHRAQIENAMALVKREMALLAEVDKPGSAIDAYVERLAEVLEQKQKGVESLRDAVRAFQTHLKEEEVLSKAVGLH